jgi:tripartite ATP-independent transporter DctM subunit
VLAAMMIVYVVVRAKVAPENAPVDPDRFTWRERIVAIGRISPALLLILLVLGSIYTGIATPTEAAAVGALAAFAVTGAIYHKLGWPNLKRIFVSTAQVTAAVLAIVGAAFVFTQMLVLARVPDAFTEFIVGLDVPATVIIIGIMLVLVVLGCLVDAASLLLVVTPILVPAIEELGYDPLWFGVLLVVNLEIAVITPPVGLNLYTMKSVVPELDLADIFRGIAPYVAIEILLLAIMIAFPQLATWLPGLLS